MKFWNTKAIVASTLVALLMGSLGTVIGGSGLAQATSADEAGASSRALLAASGSNRFVVWYDNTPGNLDILFKRSTDNGASWKPATNLSNNPGDSLHPQIAVSGSNVYVVWTQTNSDRTSTDVFFRKSTDNGASWGSKVKLSVSPYSGTNSEALPRIVVSGSNVYVTWNNDVFQVLLGRSTDNGATWKSIVNLSKTTDLAADPRIATSGSKVYVTWEEAADESSDIFFRRSTDNGATWKSKVNLSSSGSGSDFSFSSEVAASGSNVYAAWSHDGEGTGLQLRRSTDNGATWKSIVDINNNEDTGDRVNLAVSGSRVYVIWMQHISGNLDILFRRSTDNGATWKPIKNLSDNPGHSTSPQMVTAGSNVYVVWVQENIDFSKIDISIRKSANNGATWQPIDHLSDNSRISITPQVAVVGSNVYVVWRDDTPTNDDILSRRSTDGGSTWKSIKNLSNNSGDSVLGQLGV